MRIARLRDVTWFFEVMQVRDDRTGIWTQVMVTPMLWPYPLLHTISTPLWLAWWVGMGILIMEFGCDVSGPG